MIEADRELAEMLSYEAGEDYEAGTIKPDPATSSNVKVEI